MKKKKRSFLKGIFGFIIVTAILAGIAGCLVTDYIHGKMNYSGIPSVSTEPLKEAGVTNILLIGNDSREAGQDGRSDAMILLSISNETKTIHLTSLLRDMYVEIPGHDGNRLNAAYAYGGPELLMKTIEENFDVEVNRYVQVNFQAFAHLVDAVEGVELEVTNEEVKYINAYLVEYNMLEGKDVETDYLDETLNGRIHLNGPQALAYCRNRYLGTDFGRTERQRKVLSAAIRKAPKALLKDPLGLMNDILPMLTTNLTQSEIGKLFLQTPNFLVYDIVQGSLPVEGSYSNSFIRGMAVLEVDFEKNNEYIRSEIYGK